MVKADLQRFAAAKALEWGQAKGAVTGVKVDGDTVALNVAQKTLAEVKAHVPADPNIVDRWVDKIDTKVKTFEEKVSTTKTGKKVMDTLAGDPERVAKKVEVEVTFRDGHQEKVQIEVLDVDATKLLNRLSAASEAFGFIPLGIGQGIVFLGAVAASAGAKYTEWQGNNPELAEALQKTALKQWVLLGVGWVPGLATVASASAAVRDYRDQRNADDGLPASVIA